MEPIDILLQLLIDAYKRFRTPSKLYLSPASPILKGVRVGGGVDRRGSWYVGGAGRSAKFSVSGLFDGLQ